MIELIDIHKTFSRTTVLNGISLTCDAGQCLALLGPSGCGKTTLLRIVAGLETPDRGEVRIDGRTASGLGRILPPQERSLSMVFQNLALWPHMNARQNVEFALRNRRKGERLIKTESALKRVGLEGREKLYPHQLSGAERRCLALGRALAAEPAILLLDEPLCGLDAMLKSKLLVEIQQIICAMHTTTIYVTNNRKEAGFIADRVALMGRGQIEHLVAADEILAGTARVDRDHRRQPAASGPSAKVIPLYGIGPR
jgi:ABC-type Fe3+/spermidine/putrescine transport system ATPase subunit